MKITDFIQSTLVALMIAGLSLTSCNDSNTTEPPAGGYADLVVFGKVFTSESNDTAEAFAVRDGKYIAVGKRNEIEKYVGDRTETIDHKVGMVMPGCTEGHGHYIMSNFYTYGNSVIKIEDTDDKESILNAITQKAGEHPNYIFGFGFNYNKLKDEGMYPTRQSIDDIVSNIPVYLQDGEGHKGIANTCSFKNAGILDGNGKVKTNFKYKDYVVVDADGYPTGMLLEQAGTYVRSHGCIPTDDIQVWHKCAIAAQKELNKMGYTAAVEGWANKFGMLTYDAIKDMDKNGELTLDFSMAFEIENLSEDDVNDALEEAFAAHKKYSSGRVHANLIKLFEDGTPESGTGYMITPNASHSHGKPIWSLDELKNITKKANSKGMSMHIHAMGDAAVNAIIDAYENSEDNNRPDVHNQIVHLRNVAKEDYDRMSKNGIVASCGVLWHRFYPASVVKANLDNLTAIMAERYWYEGYPYQSFIDHKVHTSISTDAPASSGSPTDPFGIMEIAATGTQNFFHQTYSTAWNPEECIRNRADFLRSLTIEGAHQMGSEKLRGSIAVGKYADFILINKDVLKCDDFDLHNTKVLKTYFEGKCVFESPE